MVTLALFTVGDFVCIVCAWLMIYPFRYTKRFDHSNIIHQYIYERCDLDYEDHTSRSLHLIQITL